jgi:hypothetical protein
MYGIYLIFDWLGRHPIWSTLGASVILVTIAISWYFDRRRPR